MQITLTAKSPFSFFHAVRSHGWIQLAPFRLIDEEQGDFSYIDQLSSGRGVQLQVTGDQTGVHIDLDGDLDQSERDEIARKMTWMLNLEADFSEFYALAMDEPKLQRVVEGAYGHILRSPTLFEDTLKTILTTNTAWSGTIRMVNNLVSQFGAPLEGNPERHAFPTPERIAGADEQTLRAETRLGYRAPYVLGLAQAVASGALDLEAYKISDLPTLELRKELLAIKGVGAYAAANLLMILGRYDFLPIDSWARMVVSHEWYDGQPVSDAEVEAAFETWGEWKGMAFWFWDWNYQG